MSENKNILSTINPEQNAKKKIMVSSMVNILNNVEKIINEKYTSVLRYISLICLSKN